LYEKKQKDQDQEEKKNENHLFIGAVMVLAVVEILTRKRTGQTAHHQPRRKHYFRCTKIQAEESK
jgi:hypothetical protein